MKLALIRRTAVFAAVSIVALLLAACSMPSGSDAKAQNANAKALSAAATGGEVDLGLASTFAILSGPAVTLTSAVVNGDVGTQGAYTNTGSTVNGTVLQIPAATPNAYNDFLLAYSETRASLDMGTATLLATIPASLGPGVYYVTAAATVAGTLTLDAGGDPNAKWTFFIGAGGGGALTGTGFNVAMVNGGVPSNVTWWVADAVTMTTSNFQGTVLAGAAITLTGGTFVGDALAKAAITLTGTTLTGVVAHIGGGSGGGEQIPPPVPNFAIIGGPAVTLTGAIVTGDVGSQGAFTNTGSVIHGTVYQIPTAPPNAYNDFVLVYNATRASLDTGAATLLASLPASLAPGVYYFTAAATVTGTLTLDAGGDPNAKWTFFIGTGGTGALTGTGFNVVMANGGVPANVTWWVAEAATMTTSNFQGTILAGAAITLTGGTFNGDAMAKAAVTLTGTTLTGVSPSNDGPGDYITGGGTISINSAARSFGMHGSRNLASFAISGGMEEGLPWGELSYNDRSTNGANVKSTKITAYMVKDDMTRVIMGVSKAKHGESLTFTVTVTDSGKRGHDDVFSIVLSNGYSASGTVTNGNIQLREIGGWVHGDKHHKWNNGGLKADRYDKDEVDGIVSCDL